MPGVAEIVGDALPFVLPKGQMDLAGSYVMELGDTLRLDLNLPQITLNDLALRPYGIDEDWVEIPGLTISDVKVAMPTADHRRRPGEAAAHPGFGRAVPRPA